MGKKMDDFKQKMYNYMYGRYGGDQFNTFLTLFSLALFIPYLFIRSYFIIIAMVLIMAYTVFRTMSKNISKRQNENRIFLKIFMFIPNKVKLWIRRFKERKEYKYVKCPSCKAQLRLRRPPKGKKIEITCRKCSNTFIRKM